MILRETEIRHISLKYSCTLTVQAVDRVHSPISKSHRYDGECAP